MTPDLFTVAITVATGLLCLVAAGCVGALEIFSSPDQPNYPTARERVRVAMFCWMVALAYRGMEIIVLALKPDPVVVTSGQLVATLALTSVQVLMLESHLRLWLPARTHERIRRLVEIACCGRLEGVRAARKASTDNAAPAGRQRQAPPRSVGPALAELAREGIAVVGPGEGPEAVSQAAQHRKDMQP
jgi:hypothetical protein